MYVGERLIQNRPLGDTLWDFFFDAIHHRGQLTSYIRPMGGKVPSVYGPTADSK
ncbi:MAG: DinB family protein [Thermoanaerobaculia bacterium]